MQTNYKMHVMPLEISSFYNVLIKKKSVVIHFINDQANSHYKGQ